MIEIYIKKDSPNLGVIENIREKVVCLCQKFVIVEFEEGITPDCCRDYIEAIKSHYDLFIILKVQLPQEIAIEALYAYGIHGICFSPKGFSYSQQEIDRMVAAQAYFTNVLVFAEVNDNQQVITSLLEAGILPKLMTENQEIKKWLLAHDLYKKLAVKDVFKYLPLYREDVTYSLSDKIKMKMILEGINLRQKLRIRQVEESFNSSGL